MPDSHLARRSDAPARAQEAEDLLAAAFADAGWHVRRAAGKPDRPGPDMLIKRGGVSYAVEIKAASEGRGDRLIPLWSQACLQAIRLAPAGTAPLAVVAAPRVTPRAAEHVLEFAARYAPEVAAGIIDLAGLRRFRGPRLDELDSDSASESAATRRMVGRASDLFSDLNQWMLKVLLAPEIPDKLMFAPRGRYRSASQLAKASNVSVMSATRFVRQLERDGHLHESEPYLELVRREELFRRWQASAGRRVKEAPMRLVLRGDPDVALRKILRGGGACLGLFAAADALHMGFVHGAVPYVYVPRLNPATVREWKGVIAAQADEPPDFIVREAPAPQSVFRAVVTADGLPVSDVLQTWLDVASHPARGQEQADFIRRRFLESVIAGHRDRG